MQTSWLVLRCPIAATTAHSSQQASPTLVARGRPRSGQLGPITWPAGWRCTPAILTALRAVPSCSDGWSTRRSHSCRSRTRFVHSNGGMLDGPRASGSRALRSHAGVMGPGAGVSKSARARSPTLRPIRWTAGTGSRRSRSRPWARSGGHHCRLPAPLSDARWAERGDRGSPDLCSGDRELPSGLVFVLSLRVQSGRSSWLLRPDGRATCLAIAASRDRAGNRSRCGAMLPAAGHQRARTRWSSLRG